METVDKLVHETKNIIGRVTSGVKSTFAAVGAIANPQPQKKVFVAPPPQVVPKQPPQKTKSKFAAVEGNGGSMMGLQAPVPPPQQQQQGPQQPVSQGSDISYEQAILSGRNQPVLSPSRARQAQGILPIVQALVGVSPNSFDPSVTLDPPIPGVVSTGSLNANIPIAIGSGGVSQFGNVRGDGNAPKAAIPIGMESMSSSSHGGLKGRGK